MNSRFLLTAPLLAIFFSSCGAVNVVKDKASGATAAVKNTTAGATASVKKIQIPSFRSDRPQIVEVREKDLKELPLGKDKALAFEKERKKSFWAFAMPADFKEPVLPDFEAGDFDDAMLLPPKDPS